MIFRDLQQGYTVYVFDRNNITCKSCQVVTISQSRFDNKIGQQPQMVVDMTLDENGSRKTYVVPDNLPKAFSDSIVLSTDKAGILAEIRTLKQASDNIINSVDKHRSISQKCDGLLTELDTDFKLQKQTEEKINSLEAKIENLTKMLSDAMKSKSSCGK